MNTNAEFNYAPTWSLKMLAERWGCTLPTIYARLNDGSLKGFKVGSITRVTDENRSNYENSNPYTPR